MTSFAVLAFSFSFSFSIFSFSFSIVFYFFVLVLVFVNEFVIFSFFTTFVFVNENHTAAITHTLPVAYRMGVTGGQNPPPNGNHKFFSSRDVAIMSCLCVC